MVFHAKNAIKQAGRAIWRGLRFLLIARMREDLYDKMFPLTITPKPAKIVCASAVFDARATWFPDLKEDMHAWAKDLGNEKVDVRANAQTKFAQLDTLAKPLLEEVITSKAPETVSAGKLLLKRLQP